MRHNTGCNINASDILIVALIVAGVIAVAVVIAFATLIVLYVSMVLLKMGLFGVIPSVLFMAIVAWWFSGLLIDW